MNNFNNSPMINNNIIPQRNQYPSYFNSALGANASTNNIIWVQGIEGAKAWQLNPNSMVILLDSEVEGKMYIKVSDNIGMSSLRIFNYVEDKSTSTEVTVNQNLDLSEYVKKDELKNLIKELLTENEQSISTITKSTTNNSNVTTTAGAAKVVTVKK